VTVSSDPAATGARGAPVAAAPYAPALGERLRRVRVQQGRSLHDVETSSGGQLKASVLGAYERGERALSIGRLQAIADFYRVPITELLPTSGPRRVPGAAEQDAVIDLVALERERELRPALVRLVGSIQAKRGDHNGRVLTVRSGDLETLAAVLGSSVGELRRSLEEAGILR
jgi:transcriptional regulator with XRE-family HTH domain